MEKKTVLIAGVGSAVRFLSSPYPLGRSISIGRIRLRGILFWWFGFRLFLFAAEWIGSLGFTVSGQLSGLILRKGSFGDKR